MTTIRTYEVDGQGKGDGWLSALILKTFKMSGVAKVTAETWEVGETALVEYVLTSFDGPRLASKLVDKYLNIAKQGTVVLARTANGVFDKDGISGTYACSATTIDWSRFACAITGSSGILKAEGLATARQVAVEEIEAPVEPPAEPPVTPPVEPPVGGYEITSVTPRGIYWTGPNLTWPVRGDLCGEAHLYRADGKGGKFEHIRRNTNHREWRNIHDGYGVWGSLGQPKNGEECRLELVSYDGKKRIVVGTFKWVR